MNLSVSGQVIGEFESALLALDRQKAVQVFLQIQNNSPVLQVLENLVVPCMDHIGSMWEEGSVSLSQLYMSSRLCEDLVDQFLPPADPQRKDQPPMAIVVLEDYHLLGKRIVLSSLRASAYELLDYGHMEVDELVEAVERDNIRILLVSVLMLRSALRVSALSARLREMASPPYLIVGGAPFRFDDELYKEVGAQATGANAVEAVNLVRDFMRRS
jgi:methanogenic corrinoid protein MtbC1